VQDLNNQTFHKNSKNITPKTTFSAIRLKAGIGEIKVDPGYYVNPVKIKAR
jgi:hypothetical protein